MAGIVLYEVMDDASQEDDEGVSHNVLPLKSREMIVPVLVYLSTYHYRQSKQIYHYTDKQPTGETDPVALVEGDEDGVRGDRTPLFYALPFLSLSFAALAENGNLHLAYLGCIIPSLYVLQA